ncbi:MAG TPA: tRNA pseudouridine(38-40) synthase TruA [Lachnospiraceae bacterium]|nr:tRNA pseudouridine(38-40) synthase TruA [Lachnospiraceae bacterium]
MRIKLIVAYDGTNYHGWQVQPNGITIEEVLNKALSELFSQDIKVLGASRTDAGVHSLGNVAIFDVDSKMEPTRISYALNTRIPEDIVVLDSCRVDDDWHPHFVSSVKTYEYRILNRTFQDPLRRLNTYHYHHTLDIDKMIKAAKSFEGTHDFSAFCSVKAQVKTFERTLYSVDVRKEDDEIVIRCRGNGFLYNMVRIIAGTLIAVGQGRIKPEEIIDIIEGKDREKAGPTAPACGLTLVGIEYE